MKKIIFFAYLKSPKKRVGSELYLEPDPDPLVRCTDLDPHQNVKGPQHLLLVGKAAVSLSILASQTRIHYSIAVKIFYPVHWDWISVNNRNKEGIGENTGEFTEGNFCRLIPA